MKKYYRSVYGSTASIQINPNGTATLRVTDRHGNLFVRKRYSSARGARVALGRLDDGWCEVK